MSRAHHYVLTVMHGMAASVVLPEIAKALQRTVAQERDLTLDADQVLVRINDDQTRIEIALRDRIGKGLVGYKLVD